MLEQGLDYNDVLLIPKPSKVNSREDVELTFEFKKRDGSIVNRIPVFSAPMDTISKPVLVNLLDSAGAIGILHRSYKNQTARVQDIAHLNKKCKVFGISIGSCKEELDFGIKCWKKYTNLEFICIDVANGYLSHVAEAVKYLADSGVTNIMVGNVVTPEGVRNLYKLGAKYIRIGIGAGTQCLTRDATGIGVPQLTALEWCSADTWADTDLMLISDGGIKGSAEANKSFAFGADAVMIGSMFGKAKELENTTIRGMASREYQQEFYGEVKSVEGKVTQIETQLPFKTIWDEFLYGIKSGCTYLNCNSYKELYLADRILVGRGTLK